MEKLNFLPLWEIERIEKKRKKTAYYLIAILMICNTLLFIILMFRIRTNQRLATNESILTSMDNKVSVKNRVVNEKKVDSLKSYQWYDKEVNNKVMFKEMIIKNKEITIDAEAKDYKDYINIINYFENTCKVKDVSIAKVYDNFLEFTIILEVNHE